MYKLPIFWAIITSKLEQAGAWVALLPMRLILAWEFWDAGVMKLNGDNWFSSVQENFPFPFNVIPTEISWFMATWFEILGGLGLALGLFTRFWSISLIILTIVAILGVHWPSDWDSFSDLLMGYAISDQGYGNYKLPLIYLVIFIPFLLQGPGKLSIDHWLHRYIYQKLN